MCSAGVVQSTPAAEPELAVPCTEEARHAVDHNAELANAGRALPPTAAQAHTTQAPSCVPTSIIETRNQQSFQPQQQVCTGSARSNQCTAGAT